MEQEENKRKYIKIGKRYWIRDHYAFESDLIPGTPDILQGTGMCRCFKDEEVFWNEPDQVCYICEGAFNDFGLNDWHVVNILDDGIDVHMFHTIAWTRNQIEEWCMKWLKKHPSYVINLDDFTYQVFLEANWNLLVETTIGLDTLTVVAKKMTGRK